MRTDEWIQIASKRLADVGVPDPKLDAQMLAAHSLEADRSSVLAHPERMVPAIADQMLERRSAREPLAYILGWREFYGRRFMVESGVLIPRQETETLIDLALDGMGGKVLDIGTGSGCLAVTIKLERPNWMVAACDISSVAVKIARKNAEALGAVVHVTRSDLFAAFEGTQFGLIVSNPPYIEAGAPLQPEVGDFEPNEALYAGTDGLDVYRRLAVEAKPHLMAWGRLVLEVGDGMAEDVIEVFRGQQWDLVEARKDLGGMERALCFVQSDL